MTRVRILALLAVIGVGTSCAEPADPGTGSPGFARVAVMAEAPPSLARFAPALIVEQVQVALIKFSQQQESSDTILTRVAPFSETTNQLNLTLDVPISSVDTLFLSLVYQTADGTELFQAGDNVIVGPNRTTSPPALVPFYSGPGNNVSFISMNGDDTTVSAGSDVQFDVTAFDAVGLEVTSFYLTWSTSDPRVTVSPRGVVHTLPGKSMRVFVTAKTPNNVQTGTLMDVQGDDAFAISPDSVELRPGGTQQFGIDFGPDVSIEWTVNGVVGGDSAHGRISGGGLYTAPPTALPGDETLACVRNANNTTQVGCAKVRVPAIPSVGADIVVINDQNIFDSIPMKRAGNQRFVRNLVNFSGSGVRGSGKTVWYDRGRNSPCMIDQGFGQECGDGEKGRFNKVIEGQGYRIVKFDSYTPITTIPADVKLLVMWMPLIAYDNTEIEALKRFASEGGRITFIGERAGFYADTATGVDGIDLENSFLRQMGSGMTNLGNNIDCIDSPDDPYPISGPNSLRTHPLTAGVSTLSYACASQIEVGPNDIPFLYDIANEVVLGAVAKIDLSPPATVRAAVRSQVPGRALIPGRTRRSGMIR